MHVLHPYYGDVSRAVGARVHTQAGGHDAFSLLRRLLKAMSDKYVRSTSELVVVILN